MCRTKVSLWAAALWAVFIALSDWAVVFSLLLAALLHELSHYAAIRLCGGSVSALAFTVFGAEMRLRGRLKYGQEIGITVAGPAVNLLFALLFAWIGRWQGGFYLLSGAQAVLGAFNLLPVRPLDGGQLLWMTVAYFTEPYTADRACFYISVTVCVAFTLLAALLLARTGQGIFLLLGALVLTYQAMGEKRLVKYRKSR